MSSARKNHLQSRSLLAQSRHVQAHAKVHQERTARVNQRARGGQRDEQLPYMPPETWHEPGKIVDGFTVVEQNPGLGYRHVLTEADICTRLQQVPRQFLQNLEVVQLSQMTRKKHGFPCYGIQWGAAIYLYPIEQSLVERYHQPPTPRLLTEAKMYGGVWEQESARTWRLVWTEETIRDFYLNNILIHELGHLVDQRNSRYLDRERYAEWFAVEYGYKQSRRPDGTRRTVTRRHHSARVQRFSA